MCFEKPITFVISTSPVRLASVEMSQAKRKEMSHFFTDFCAASEQAARQSGDVYSRWIARARYVAAPRTPENVI